MKGLGFRKGLIGLEFDWCRSFRCVPLKAFVFGLTGDDSNLFSEIPPLSPFESNFPMLLFLYYFKI